MISIGFTLQPDELFLDVLDDLIEHEVDYYEVAPETLWWVDSGGHLLPNGFHRRFAALKERTGRPFVAHGVAFSLGTESPKDSRRRKRHLTRLAEDQRIFEFLWYTDHLGVSSVDGLAATLPLPVPMTAHSAKVVARSKVDRKRQRRPVLQRR